MEEQTISSNHSIVSEKGDNTNNVNNANQGNKENSLPTYLAVLLTQSKFSFPDRDQGIIFPAVNGVSKNDIIAEVR